MILQLDGWKHPLDIASSVMVVVDHEERLGVTALFEKPFEKNDMFRGNILMKVLTRNLKIPGTHFDQQSQTHHDCRKHFKN